MTEPLLIPCPNCNGLNRIPGERLSDSPRCGRCKNPVLLNSPLELNSSNFSNQIKGDLPLVVDVWASWCGPCQAFAPTFTQAAAQLKGRARFAKLDSEANQQLAGQLAIRSIPSLIVYRQGKEVGRESGAMSMAQLVSWLSQHGI